MPNSKENVYNQMYTLPADKYWLMRFLMFAIPEFEGKPKISGKEDEPSVQCLQHRGGFVLEEELVQAVAYALAYCTSIHGPYPLTPTCLSALMSLLSHVPQMPRSLPSAASTRSFVPQIAMAPRPSSSPTTMQTQFLRRLIDKGALYRRATRLRGNAHLRPHHLRRRPPPAGTEAWREACNDAGTRFCCFTRTRGVIVP
jgi:hypothetical protein